VPLARYSAVVSSRAQSCPRVGGSKYKLVIVDMSSHLSPDVPAWFPVRPVGRCLVSLVGARLLFLGFAEVVLRLLAQCTFRVGGCPSLVFVTGSGSGGAAEKKDVRRGTPLRQPRFATLPLVATPDSVLFGGGGTSFLLFVLERTGRA